MALIPQFYTASTREIAEKSLELGILKYPSMCYIKTEDVLAWVTKDNKINYITGDNQITDITFKDQILSFYGSNGNTLFSENISIPENIIEDTKNQILNSIDFSDYIKQTALDKILDDYIGDLEGAPTVVDYIKNLNYAELVDIPIENKFGSMSDAIFISELDDGVYRINGTYIIGGDSLTIQNTVNSFFVIEHTSNGMTATEIRGNKIIVYTIQNSITTNTEYITEKWIKENDFIKSSEAKTYISNQIETMLKDTVRQEVKEQLFYVLDENIGDYVSYLEKEDIDSLFS